MHISGINITSIKNTFNAGWLSLPQTRQNINLIGTNPIASIGEDTPSKWVSLRTGVAFFNINGLVNQQPSRYAFVENFASGGNVFQIWHSQSYSGTMYIRAGDQVSGWYFSWMTVLDEKHGIQIKKVWENASPTSEFAEQRISLSNAGSYDLFLVEARRNTTLTSMSFYTFCQPDRKGQLEMYINLDVDYKVLFCARECDVSTSENIIEFGDSYSKHADYELTGIVNNTRIIPVAIYGIKGVR